MRKIITTSLIAAMLSGCATMPTPRNQIGSYYAFTQTPDDHRLAKQCLQEGLVKPSSVTAPGIRVYLSNLTRPANHNAGSAIGAHATSLPYGSRLSQGMHSANCVGGSAMNAGRQLVLFSRNPINGKSVVISRSIEGLVREANRDGGDPYLMPGDSIACYDSMAMNLRDVVSVIGETATPFLFFNNLD